jgi:hypothetical protein
MALFYEQDVIFSEKWVLPHPVLVSFYPLAYHIELKTRENQIGIGLTLLEALGTPLVWPLDLLSVHHLFHDLLL